MNPTTQRTTSAYSGIKQAQGMRGGIYYSANKIVKPDGTEELVPANYRSLIHRCKHDRDRFGVEMFICETEILASDNPSLPIGTQVGVVIKFDKDAALGNVKDIVSAGLASQSCKHGEFVTPEQVAPMVDEDLILGKIVGEVNMLAGAEVQLYAFNKPTKAGKDFTRLVWSVPADVQAAAKGTNSVVGNR